jgi:broad specificity phosphatase PhoE
MPIIYLVRHAEKQKGVANPPLTKLGHQQAKKTGLFLRKFPISKIIASPYLRTQQTAQHIADALKLPFTTDERLKERIHWQIDKLAWQSFIDEWAKTSLDRDYLPLWGDSSRQAGDRIQLVAEENSTTDDQHLVLVTHGGTLIDFLRNVFDEKHLKALIREFPEGPDYIADECSVTRIKLANGRYELLDLHLTSHLK